MVTQGNRHQPGLSQEIGDSHLLRVPTQSPAPSRRGRAGATLTQLGGSGHTLPTGEPISPPAHSGRKGMQADPLSWRVRPPLPLAPFGAAAPHQVGCWALGQPQGHPRPGAALLELVFRGGIERQKADAEQITQTDTKSHPWGCHQGNPAP